MPSTLPAIVTPRVGSDLGQGIADAERGAALAGIAAATAAVRGALFEASGRNSPSLQLPTSLAATGPGSPSARALSAASIALLLSATPAPNQPPVPSAVRSGSLGAGAATGPASLLGFLGAGATGAGGVGASGSGGAGAGGIAGGGEGGAAAQSAAALRAAAESLAEVLEAAVRAREAQNRAMLTATRETLAPGTSTSASPPLGPSRPASARGLDSALTAARTHGSALAPFSTPMGGAAAHSDERLGWVRNLVRQTEGGLAYAAAAEERERERLGAGEGGADPVRRGSLPALRPARREDVLLLQSWLADTLQQVIAASARASAAAAVAAAGEPGGWGGFGLGRTSPVAGTSAAGGGGGSAGAVAAAGGAGDPGAQATRAAELADAALYVIGVATEEVRRQVAAECKERGELLGGLLDAQAALGSLRGGLAAEGRAAEVAGQWAALLAERERAGLGAVVSEGGTVSVAPGASASGLAARLVAAQEAAAAAEKRFMLADGALAGEAARRVAAEQQLEAVRELLRRQEHEWLHHKAQNARLEGEVAGLRDALENAKRQATVAEATAEAAREQTISNRDDVSQLESALARMRTQYEGNEILVAAQRQQIRDLEAALAALREQHREQAVALGKVGQVTAQYEAAAAALRASLASETSRADGLAAELADTAARLAAAEARLTASDAALTEVRASLAAAEAASGKAAHEAEVLARRLRQELADAVEGRRQEETKRGALEKELAALVELTKLVGRTLALQGFDGVPSMSDRSWEQTGPLGAAQKVLGFTTQQLAMLYGHGEDTARAMRAVQAKLAEEKEAAAKLARDLYDARTTEARMLREREIADMRLATIEHELRGAQTDLLRVRASSVDSEARVKVQHETIVSLQAQVKELPPLKKRVEGLYSDMELVKKREEDTRQNLEVTKQHLTQAEDTSRFYQAEVTKLLGEREGLQAEVKALRGVAGKLGDQEALNRDLEKQIIALRHQLDMVAHSHTDTLKQLELAKFFLQGLELGPGAPNSPGRSSISNISPSTRDRAAAGTSGGGNAPSSPSPPGRGGAGASGRFPSPPSLRAPLASSARFSDLPPGSPLATGGGGDGASEPTLNGDDATSEVSFRPGAVPPSRGRLGSISSVGGGSARGSALTAAALAGRPVSAAVGAGSGAGSRGGSSWRSRGGGGGGARTGGTPSPVGSRPVSAVSGVPPSSPGLDGEEDSVYSAEVPNEVFQIMQTRGLTSRVATSTHKWAGIKIGIMAWFSKQLRARLLTVTEQLAARDLEIAQLHVNYLTEMRQREEFISNELLPTLLPALDTALQDAHREVSDLRSQLPGARKDMDAMAGSTAIMAISLKGYRDREAHAVSRSCQTDVEVADDWARFIARLPPLPPGLSLSLASLTDSIVRVYVRAVASVESVPTWGPPRHDTIHDAIMAHYASQVAPGAFLVDLVRDPESPIARLLSSAQLLAKNTKVAMFLYFLNLSPEGVHWPAASWHFFLHLLHCMRVLLSGTWRVMTKRWASPEGVQIPMPAVLDLVGNLFNVQSPGELDGAVSVRLAAIVTPGSAGPAVDLDALLLLLVREYNSGNCPRAPLLFPRRLTDGQLFNIFNSAGHNTHVDMLRNHTAEKFIGPQPITAAAPPGLVTGTGPKRLQLSPGAGLNAAAAAAANAGFRPAASASAATAALLLAPGSPPLTASGADYGGGAGGGGGVDALHPYGDLPDARSRPGSFTSIPGASQMIAGATAAYLGRDEEAAAEDGDGNGPDGSLTVNYQISHEQHVSEVVVVGRPAPSTSNSGVGIGSVSPSVSASIAAGGVEALAAALATVSSVGTGASSNRLSVLSATARRKH